MKLSFKLFDRLSIKDPFINKKIIFIYKSIQFVSLICIKHFNDTTVNTISGHLEPNKQMEIGSRRTWKIHFHCAETWSWGHSHISERLIHLRVLKIRQISTHHVCGNEFATHGRDALDSLGA